MHSCIYVLFSTDFPVADYDDKPDYKSCTPWGSTQIFYHGTPYFQIATTEYTSEGDFIYAHKKSKAFSAPIFTNSCQSSVHNFIQSHEKCWIHGKFSFTLREVGFHYIELHETHKCSKIAVDIYCNLDFFIDKKKSFRSHYGPGVDSASNRNEY